MLSDFPFRHTTALVRVALAGLLLAIAVPLASTTADARLGGGSSFGSRGTRTFSMPPSTSTAPRPAFPLQRTETPTFGASRPAFGAPRFGFGSGLAAGLLGAGLFGLLTGHGFFGGIGGIGSLFGFLIQLVLIVFVIRFALNFFRSRSGAAFAGPGSAPRQTFAGLGGGLGGLGAAGATGRATPLAISPDDYAAFERILSDVQYAYAREDLQALSRLATPEMVRFLSADLTANQSRGVRNDMSDVRLLQGDLAEAWREGVSDFATVAMRFAARDVMLDRATGRLVSGDPTRPVEATELWTFRRNQGGPWVLSAVQQTN